MSTFNPIRNRVFVTDLERGMQKTKSGIIIPDDNVTERGIHARWGKVYKVGPDIDDIRVGDWILIEHGRWSAKFDVDGDVTVWHIDYPSGILLISDEDPRTTTKI